MPPLTSSTDFALLARAQAGDPDAYEALVDRPHRERLTKLALGKLGDLDLAAQVAQDTLFKAWRALPGFGRDPRSGGYDLAGWLSTICHNRCLDILRHRQLISMVPFDITLHDRGGPARPAVDVIIAANDRARIQWALAQLPRRDRAALILHYVEGLTVEEMTPLFAAPGWGIIRRRHVTFGRPGVKALLDRARRRLRSVLAAYDAHEAAA